MNCLRRMSLFIYVASENVWWANAYLICAMFDFQSISPDRWMLYPFTYAACLNPYMMCLQNHVVCGNSFIKLAKLALSPSLFVVSSTGIFIQHAQFFMWYGQSHLLTFGGCCRWISSHMTWVFLVSFRALVCPRRFIGRRRNWKFSFNVASFQESPAQCWKSFPY